VVPNLEPQVKTMKETQSKNAVNALLSEYYTVLQALKRAMEGISFSDLSTIVDSTTANPECRSVQSILTHVVNSGYAYCGYIRKVTKQHHEFVRKGLYNSVEKYQEELDSLFVYTTLTFEKIHDEDIEEFDEDKKIKSSWGQVYDIEQMMEHAIVHVARHRRQIEKFRKRFEAL